MTASNVVEADSAKAASRGERTRLAILEEAAAIAAAEGLEGLSIGRLASALEMSKSGLFAHFGSKEDLQVATVEFVRNRSDREIVAAVEQRVPERGLERLWGLADGYLTRVQNKATTGGCFLYSASAEFDSRPGRVRDVIAAQLRGWLAVLRSNARAAVERGELLPETDVELLTFEVSELLFAANRHFLLLDNEDAFEMSRRAVAQRLRLSAPGGVLPPFEGLPER